MTAPAGANLESENATCGWFRLKAQGLSRTCNESNEEKKGFRHLGLGLSVIFGSGIRV